MTIHFYEPPPHQKVGGLDLAVTCLARCLADAGVVLKRHPGASPEPVFQAGADALVHFHGIWQPSFLKVSRSCRSSRIPYLVSPHGMLEPWAWNQKRWKKWPYFALFERRHLTRADRLLATSDLEAENLRRLLPQPPISVIPLGLPEEQPPDYAAARLRLKWDPREKVLLFLSRIHPKKGLELLLHSLASVPRAESPLRLVIIGEGDPSYVRSLKAQAERLKDYLPPVEWIGPVWDAKKWSYLQGADLFCLPSFSENFGLAVLEALQVGTRVLTTNTGPWAFLREWNAGFIVEPAVAGVAQALAAFLASPDWDNAARSRLAWRTRQKFGWETLGPQYLRLYQDLQRSN